MPASRPKVRNERAPEACHTARHDVLQTTEHTFEDALHAAVDALGGPKVVGSWLRPELHPETAREWLSHCISGRTRDKLSLKQIAAIFRRAHQRGAHDGMARLCGALGYAPAAPIAERDVIADMQRQVLAAAQRATDLSIELTARMRHANIKVDL